MEIPSLVPQRRRKRKQAPTVKQIKALQNLAQGLSMRQSLIRAGYSMKQANKGKQFFFGMRGAREALESMTQHLIDQGLTPAFMAKKVKEFVDAKKIDHSHTEPDKLVPDYRTQIEGVKLWREIRNENIKGAQGKKREITLTEFITGKDARQ